MAIGRLSPMARVSWRRPLGSNMARRVLHRLMGLALPPTQI